MTTDSLPMPDDQDSAPASEEAVKPKRARRTKAAEAAEAASVETAGTAPAADAQAPKRAPRRRNRP